MKRIQLMKNLLGVCLSVLMVLTTPLMTSAVKAGEDVSYSEEYRGCKYYSQLQTALAESRDQDVMSRVLAVAKSQEGYQDYYLGNTTPEAAREAGYLWTGEDSGDDNTYGSGNTEYTRWAQEYVMDRSGDEIYLDCDWCAIFASWCMYQAGYYSEAQLKKYFYSYYADPREERTAGSWIEAFNFDHDRVWYTPTAAGKVAAYSWGRYTHTDVDPYEIPYRPGGMIFFSWDASGRYFSHVGIVVSYDADTHELTYINGNVECAVTTRVMDLDADEEYHGQVQTVNANRIMAYAEYGVYTEPAKKEITAEKTDFEWVRGSGEEILVKTNSESKTVLLTADSGFFDSNQSWPAQLILRYGEVTIGAPLLDYLPDGLNIVTLDFADGTLTIRIRITSPVIGADRTIFDWKRNSEEGITVQTTSTSRTVTVYGDGFTAQTKSGEVSIEDGKVTLSPHLLNRMKDGEGILTLVFDDGILTIRIRVNMSKREERQEEQKEEPAVTPEYDLKAIRADQTAFLWNRKNKQGITIRTDSSSATVTAFGDGFFSGSKDGELTIEKGKVTISPAFLNRMKNGEGSLALVFEDGALAIRIHVFEEGWQTENGERYFYLPDGSRKTGWLSDGGKWYYLNADGVMQTGWLRWKGSWYYLDRSGKMATGWRKISGKWYYLKKNGVMASSEWINGYWLSKNGSWSYPHRGSWHKDRNGWWYGDTSGWFAKDASYSIDGKVYAFDEKGYQAE